MSMSIRLWRSLPDREAGGSAASPAGADPSESLEIKLRSWIEDCLYDQDVERIALRLDIPDAFEDSSYLYDDTNIHANDLYSVIDAMLDLQPSGAEYFAIQRDTLQELLDDSVSVYTLSQDGRGLARRADPVAAAAMTASVEQASGRSDAGSAAEHLTNAWSAAYAINPDPVKSYSESIKAVEAAAHAIVEPNNAKATLGTMIGQMRSRPNDFCLLLPGPGVSVSPVIEMMSALWGGQTSRHGGQNPTRAEETWEACAAAQLAVTLVHWFSCGIVSRK